MTVGVSVVEVSASPEEVPDRWAQIAAENVAVSSGRFSAVADPFKVIHVDPRNVRRRCLMHSDTRRSRGSKYHDWGRVLPGDWDTTWRGESNPPLRGLPKWEAVLDRYAGGMSWEQTGIIEVVLRRIQEVGGAWSTREEVAERYRRLDEVFEDMRVQGFRLSCELEDGHFEDDLFVSIGHDGRLLRARHGNHRLAMAAVLGLTRIPVYVLTRHERWQSFRDRCRVRASRGESTGFRIRHPDMEDLWA